jgi:phosphatidylglycerol:prolipoprotein diacylglycerol transferase
MSPVLFEIPYFGFKIFGYGLMLFIAYVASISMTSWRARKGHMNPQFAFDLATWLFIGGIVGARVFFVIQYRDRFTSFFDIFKIWEGGIVFYGSLIGGALAFFAIWAIKRFPLLPMADAIAPALCIGLAIGRLGCFLNGCCYGDRCDLPWAVRFPAGSAPFKDQVSVGLLAPNALASLPLHPTQLYSTIDGLVILFVVLAFWPFRKADGHAMALYFMLYSVTRFLVEQLRNDESAQYYGMTISQLISLGVFASGVLLWTIALRYGRPRYADTHPPYQEPAIPALSQAELG